MNKYIIILILLLLSGCNCKSLPDILSSGCYAEDNECEECETYNTPIKKERDT